MPLPPEIEATYEILAKMGEGGMGAVYKVRHRFFDEIRVIKVLHDQFLGAASIQERFLSEAKRGKQLDHPNLAKVLDFSVAADGTAYMVMEYIEGVTLRDVLARNDGPIDFHWLLPVAEQVLDALGYLHSRKLVHRDISPDNIMLTSSGATPHVKLIDLGIAKSLDTTSRLTMAGKFLGKVKYAAPEQFSGEADARSDLYAFGVVLYELLTGVMPITGKDNMSLIAGVVTKPPREFGETDPEGLVPSHVRTAILRALAKSPNDRFQSAEEFAEALHEPEPTLVDLPMPEAAPKPRRWFAIATVAALLLTAALVLLLVNERTGSVAPQAQPSRGSIAVEAPRETPVEVAKGQLVINALPWGEVTSVKNRDGAEQLSARAATPIVLELPEGEYKVELVNPNSKRSVVLDAKVSANGVARCEAPLDHVDADEYVKGIGR